ncbi:MAG: DUF2059 domain-containing protein [Novosphingobium sp.]
MKALSFAAALTISCAMPTAALAQSAPAAAPAAPAAIDPERLAAARITAGKLFPDGTYARMMSGMDGLMDSVMGQVGEMPMADLARMGGLPESELKNVSKGSLKEMMAILDPAYDKRMSASMKVMMGEMGRIMTPLEPGMREGLAQSYAKRFSAKELAELNTFFATPTGSAFASESMLLMMDPAGRNKMMEFVLALTKEMPDIIKKMQAATAGLPKPKGYKDLTAAERKRLADLLGVPADKMDKEKASD